jgi:hypothetical protein
MEVVLNSEITDLAKAITAQVAPEELEFFDDLVRSAQQVSKSRGDHPVGFGVSEGIVGTIAVVAVSIAKSLLQKIWEEVEPSIVGLAKDAAEQLRLSISDRIKNWIKNGMSYSVPINLSEQTRSAILANALEEAKLQGVSSDSCDRLASLLRSALAID